MEKDQKEKPEQEQETKQEEVEEKVETQEKHEKKEKKKHHHHHHEPAQPEKIHVRGLTCFLIIKKTHNLRSFFLSIRTPVLLLKYINVLKTLIIRL